MSGTPCADEPRVFYRTASAERLIQAFIPFSLFPGTPLATRGVSFLAFALHSAQVESNAIHASQQYDECRIQEQRRESLIMAEQKFSIERDVKEAQAMAAALVPYVYEDELYGRIGMNMPSLTIGALLMRLHRLRALASRLTPEQLGILEQAEAQTQSARREWTSHFEK